MREARHSMCLVDTTFLIVGWSVGWENSSVWVISVPLAAARKEGGEGGGGVGRTVLC